MDETDNIPFRSGNFCSSLFLDTLNRDEFCLLSFFMWGGPWYLSFAMEVGGGCVSALLALCEEFFRLAAWSQ